MIALLPLLVLAATPAVSAASAQQTAEPSSPPTESAAAPAAKQAPARIQWFGTLEQGLAEAKRTNRPLLMTAAAPACRGIAGMW